MNKLYNYLVKDGDAIAVGVSAVLFVIFGLGIYLGSSSGGYSLSELTDMEDLSQINCFNPGLWTMIWMCFIAVVLMILGIVWDIFRNYKSGSKSVYGFLAIIAAFVVLYFTSSHDTGGRFDAYWAKDFGITEMLSKFISAGLYSLGLLTFLAFLLILVFEIRAFFK
jgi:hypothetical protein